MNTQGKLLILCIWFIATCCAPKVSKTITKSYVPLDYKEDVLVLDLQTPIPDNAENMGTVKIGDNGFSTKCDWNTVIETAKMEARKVGGNAIKIMKHKPPSALGSSCHRITAAVLHIDNVGEIAVAAKNDDVTADWDYAMLYIYRLGGAGALVGYDVHLGNVVICRTKNNWKTTIQIRSFGLNTVWASTESKTEISVDFEPGREYYIRCGIKMGVAVGRPTLELVDKNTGKAEYSSIKTN
jgi:hypothetical protein